MRNPSARAAALIALTLIGAGATVVAVAAPGSAADAGPERRVIVELAGAPALRAVPAARRGLRDAATLKAVADARRTVATAQQGLIARARSEGIYITVERSFTGLLNAVAVRGTPAEDDRLRRLPGVVAVHPDLPMRASTDVSVPLIGAPDVWKRQDGKGRPARGTGVTVAIIDSGVDYTHPSLGGGFGPGHKVVAGHDFINNDDDPMDDNAHGTHVAGIIAGTGGGGQAGVTGVAPDATITAYKVLDDYGDGYESTVIAGLEAATDPANPHRADVVNMSLGGVGDGTDPIGRAATAAAAGGAVVIAAAGNAGPGAQTVGTPAAADGVIAVGASTSGLRIPTAYLRTDAPGARKVPVQAYRSAFSANPPAKPVTGAIVDVGEGTPADYEKAGDVRGKVVLYTDGAPANPGDVSPDDVARARDAEKRGAIAVLGYDQFGDVAPQLNDPAGELRAAPRTLDSGDSLRMDHLVVMGISATQRAELVGAPGGRITIEGTDATDRIASFSSRGPTARFGLKPDLVAPGVEIRSAVPTALYKPGEYRLSGTSMAAPHVAGAAALLRQLRPEQNATELGASLIGSAARVDGPSPTAQGAGRLDVRAAAAATVTAAPATLSLGLADLAGPTVTASATVTLHNSGKDAVTAALRGESAPGSPGDVRVTPAQVDLPAGGTATVTVAVEAATPAADTDLAGWVTADLPGDAPDVRVPYLLAARPLLVQASPDPSDGTSTVFVHSVVPLNAPPVITVVPPKGAPTEVTARQDHDTWYRAEIRGDADGVYRVVAKGVAAGGTHLSGGGVFEVVPADQRGNRTKWAAVGPNATSGELATSSADEGLGVMTTFGKSGLWVTEDRGASWVQRNRLPVAGGAGTVVTDARNGDRIWYGINGSDSANLWDPTYQGKVLRSTDRGRTWTTLRFPDVHLDAFTGTGDVLVALSDEALNVSRDGGETWTTRPVDWGGRAADSASLVGGDLYVGTSRGVWVLRGVAGEPTAPERLLDTDSAYVYGMAADEHVIAVAQSGGTIVGSHDGGKTWNTLYKTPSRGALYLRIAEGDVFVAGFDENYVSHDHGKTWSTLKMPVRGPIAVDFDRWHGDPDTMLVSAEQAGLYGTGDDGAHYRRVGVQGLSVEAVAVGRDAAGAATLLAGTVSGVYRTALPAGPITPTTAEWGASGGEGYVGVRVPLLTASPADPTVVWRVRTSAIGDFSIDQSTDGGATWTTKGRTTEFPDALLVHPAEKNRVSVAFHRIGMAGLYTSADGGKTWRTFTMPGLVNALAGDPLHADRLWIGTAAGLYRSDDGGRTTVKVLDGRVSALSTDAAAPYRIVAGGDAIRTSLNGGKTFAVADTGGLPMRVGDIVAVPGAKTTLYAGTTSFASHGLPTGGRGVLRSRDGGRSWTNVSGGLQNSDITSLAVSGDAHWLFAGTRDGGVHRLRLGPPQ